MNLQESFCMPSKFFVGSGLIIWNWIVANIIDDMNYELTMTQM